MGRVLRRFWVGPGGVCFDFKVVWPGQARRLPPRGWLSQVSLSLDDAAGSSGVGRSTEPQRPAFALQVWVQTDKDKELGEAGAGRGGS